MRRQPGRMRPGRGVAPASGTLPPAENLYEAPRGASGMTYQGQAALHLPSRDGQRLLAQYEALELSRASDNAEAIVRALLSHPSTEEVSALGGGVNITLYGVRPVEVSGGVCTVNLSASALQLEKRQFYTLCMALASTLCELDGILHVNVLVADQPVGLDVVSALPMGAVTSHPGEDLPALWEQQIAKGTPWATTSPPRPSPPPPRSIFRFRTAAGLCRRPGTSAFRDSPPRSSLPPCLRRSPPEPSTSRGPAPCPT